MTALNIDTLKFARRLKEAGADEKLGEAIAEGMAEVDTSKLATKSDLAELKAEIMKMNMVTALEIGRAHV